MKRLKLSVSPIYKLGNMDFGLFVQSQIDRIRDLGETELTDDQLKAIIATLLGLTTKFDKVLARIRKSAITDELKALNHQRKTTIRAFTKQLEVHSLSLDQNVLRAVAELDAILNPYGNLLEKKQEEATESIFSMVARLEEPANAELVTLLAMNGIVARLKADNQAFWNRYNDRTTVYLEKVTTDTTELRNDIVVQYGLLCDYVEVNANLGNDPVFAKVFSIIDTIRKQFMAQVKRGADHKPTAKKEKPSDKTVETPAKKEETPAPK